LFCITLFITRDKGEQREAYAAWKEERMYFQLEIYNTTVDRYRELYPVLKEQYAFLFEYGQCLSKTGQYSESNRILAEAARLSPDPMIRNIMGKNYQALRQYEEAENYFYQAHYMVPNRLYPLYLLAKLYIESGKTGKAVVIACQVINTVPKITSPATDDMKREMKTFLQQTGNI
jgi:tetratricopeptide (TPR) repeat protein